MAYDLLEVFLLSIQSCVLGSRAVQTAWIENEDPAPRVRLPAFSTMKGESREQALTRLKADFERATAAIMAGRDDKKAGRRPRTKVPAIERNPRWFYRHRVEGVSKDAFAREHCKAEHANRDHDWRNYRKLVSVGIDDAERLLGLAQYEWK